MNRIDPDLPVLYICDFRLNSPHQHIYKMAINRLTYNSRTNKPLHYSNHKIASE